MDMATIPKLFENISHSMKVFYARHVLQHLFNALPVIVRQMILRHSASLPTIYLTIGRKGKKPHF